MEGFPLPKSKLQEKHCSVSLEVPRTPENAHHYYFMFCLPEKLQVAIEHASRSIRTFPIIAGNNSEQFPLFLILLETCYEASHIVSCVVV